MRNETIGTSVVFAAGALAVASVLMTACGDDETVSPAVVEGGGGAGGGVVGGSGGIEYVPGRGDPADFPSQCLETCVEACDRLQECGGDASELFPVEYDACLVRCGLAEDGPVWDDVSANFKCCASQDSCQPVEHCGGWLDHPSALNSCEQLCGCFFNSSVAALNQDQQPIEGYRFADAAVIVELSESISPAVDGVQIERTGRYASVRFSRDAGQSQLAALRAMGTLLPTFRDRDGRLVAATGRIIASLPTTSSRATGDAIVQTHGGTSLRGLSFGPALQLYEVEPDKSLAALAALKAAGIDAELDMVRSYVRRYIPNDPLFDDQWHLLNTGQGESVDGVDARVSEAWDVTQGDAQVIIAINDDGMDINHEDFTGKLEPELNFISDWMEQMAIGNFGNHGTSVAGVAAALADDSVGGAGVCPGCRVLPHQLGAFSFTSFQLTDSEIADGFQNQVDAGAWVINNSWGFATGEPAYADSSLPLPPLPMIISGAFDYADQNGRSGLGTLNVFAAGNSNDQLDPYSAYPTTVAVAAVGDNGLKSYYSSFGPDVDIAAPSNGALTGITTSKAGGGHVDNFGGTSSAAPFVAGVFGLVLSANPALTAAEARDIVEQSASQIDPMYGAWTDGKSPYYGAGMINAYVAVQMANGSCADPANCPAPSDDCGGTCGTAMLCDNCRTTADCAADHVCQALASLGEMVCVPTDTAGCPAGTSAVNGYCLPTLQTCGLCGTQEECNGRDDDCNGSVDDGGVCGGNARCFIDGIGCETGQVCAGSSCVTACASDDECSDAEQCKVVKDQFGTVVDSVKGCVGNQVGGCELGCSVLVSSLDDATMTQFVDCMMDGQAACSAVQGCSLLLPIQF